MREQQARVSEAACERRDRQRERRKSERRIKGERTTSKSFRRDLRQKRETKRGGHMTEKMKGERTTSKDVIRDL